jgi:uncharacterized protein (DUF302 family)
MRLAPKSGVSCRMTMIVPLENVIAVRTELGFERTLESLRIELPRREFRILSEVNFSRELDSHIGLATSLYRVLIVWHPFAAYQALLSNLNGGLMIPFNLAVYQNGGTTTVSVLNQPSLMPDASLGIRTLGEELNRQMREVLREIGTHERTLNRHGTGGSKRARGR